MTVTVLTGDCRDVLRTLPDESVHCVVTSPPYWGLRDYGTAKWEGGDAACGHKVREKQSAETSTLGGGKTTTGHAQEGFESKCPRCGARRVDNQLGMEPSLAEHVETMRAVFAEVRRVLRADGTLWLNYGDSYAASVNGRSARDTKNLNRDDRSFVDKPFNTIVGSGLKPKDMCGVPWRVAFALQADGWWLRSDIIWSKPNPMPESITDRPTKAHEYVFLLAKSERYFYDAEAIKERSITNDPRRPYTSEGAKQLDGRAKWHSGEPRNGNDFTSRNRRTVWEIPTAPFPEAHFATFPPALVEPCILAGCPHKCCAECGAPWVAVSVKTAHSFLTRPQACQQHHAASLFPVPACSRIPLWFSHSQGH
jgi:DNA modification methylase